MRISSKRNNQELVILFIYYFSLEVGSDVTQNFDLISVQQKVCNLY